MITKISLLCNAFFKRAAGGNLRDILQTLSESKTFKNSLNICMNNFQKLGAGSARVVFLVDDNVVLKLAKNAKGLAQNNIESDGFLNTSWLANGSIDADPGDKWILTKLAKRINKSRFKSLTGLDFEKFGIALEIWHAKHNGRKSFYSMPEEEFNTYIENNFFSELIDLIGNMDLMIGDLKRINSYGEVDGKIKVVDLGTTRSVYEEYYKG